jgi:hypothetical protein
MGAASSARMCEIPIRTGEAIVGLSRVECLQTALLLPVLYRDLSTSRFTSILPDLARPKKWPHSDCLPAPRVSPAPTNHNSAAQSQHFQYLKFCRSPRFLRRGRRPSANFTGHVPLFVWNA